MVNVVREGTGVSIALRGAASVAVSVIVSVGIATKPLTVAAEVSVVSSRAEVGPSDGVVPLANFNQSRVASESGKQATIPIWTSSVTASQNRKWYQVTMVGQDPRARLSNPTTTIVANVIPIVVTLGDGTTLDPTKTSCGETVSPLNAVLASPIFNDTTFKPHGTNVGDTQYIDAFQRANFWTYTNPTGINPGYHVLLKPKLGKTITIKVPAPDGQAFSRRGCTAAAVTMAYAVQQGLKLIPSLAGKDWGVYPTTFPIFLLHNVEFDTTLGESADVGFHAAIPNPAFQGAAQTVAVASYLDPAIAPHESDVAVLSHEVGEWMNDPFGKNGTPPWGNTGQVHDQCQSNLEVGDPLTGTTFAVGRHGIGYHLQELAFFSWFYGSRPSIGVNGDYSFNGTFTDPAPLCPPGGPRQPTATQSSPEPRFGTNATDTLNPDLRQRPRCSRS
jgi:hypothetical protein